MSAILLAAFLYRTTLLGPPPTKLEALYASAGFTPSECGVTEWDRSMRPEEAECSDGRGNWMHFDLDPSAFDAPLLITNLVQLDPIVPSKENGPESEALSR